MIYWVCAGLSSDGCSILSLVPHPSQEGMHVDRCLHSPRTCAVTAFLVEIVHCRTHSIWTQFPLISKVVIGCVIWQIAWRRITEIKGDTRNGFLDKSSISFFFSVQKGHISLSLVSCFYFSLTNLRFNPIFNWAFWEQVFTGGGSIWSPFRSWPRRGRLPRNFAWMSRHM